MGKNKLKRFLENETFKNLIQHIPTFTGPDYELKGKWNKQFFKNNNEIILELGCGRAEYTIGLAQMFPERNFIGVDIKGARLWRGAKTAQENLLKNVAFIRTRIQMIDKFFDKSEIAEIWITFPDPQPRESKENKRLCGPYLLNTYKKFLKKNGIVHVKTDNTNLFQFTKQCAKENGYSILHEISDLYSNHVNAELSIQTTYEKRFIKAGCTIKYLRLQHV